MDDYIAKPVDAAMLKEKVDHWIGSAHPGSKSPTGQIRAAM
jgi:hypothetical protein